MWGDVIKMDIHEIICKVFGWFESYGHTYVML